MNETLKPKNRIVWQPNFWGIGFDFCITHKGLWLVLHFGPREVEINYWWR